MKNKYPDLCAPITLGRVNFRNRIFSAPMGGTDIANTIHTSCHAALDI